MSRRKRQEALFEELQSGADEEPRCEVCLHEYERRELTRHHVVPKSRGGTETVLLCRPCHKQVHALFTEKELEREYGTVDALLSADEMQPWLQFIRKRKPTKKLTVRTSKSKGR